MNMETIEAEILGIKFKENGFLIANAQLHPSGGRITIVGPMLEPKIGQRYALDGTEEYNERFRCKQFRFINYRPLTPPDADGIMRYLVQTAAWIGPATARKLVETHGKETLTVIRDEPERVIGHIPGLTEERVREMQASLQAAQRTETAMIEVGQIVGGTLGPGTVRKIVERWGEKAAGVIKRNPYTLTALRGVGFLSADALYKRLGLPADSPKRHTLAAAYVLGEIAGREGHTVCREMQLKSETVQLVGTMHSKSLRLGRRAGLFQSETNGADTVQLRELAESEAYVASKIVALRSEAASTARDRPVEVNQNGMAQDQQNAAATVATEAISILTGAPGTGKTWTLARIVQAAERAGLTVVLCAPTGKAAKQMSRALAGTCRAVPQTIHSTLQAQMNDDGEFEFVCNESCPLNCDIMVVDESSMIDVRLARSLLRAIQPPTRILFVGDHYQLPSVGPGAVLRDLIDAGVPMAELTEIKRNKGLIVRACHAMKDGQTIVPADRLDLDAGDNWRHIDAAEPAHIQEVIRQLLAEKLPKLGIDPKWQAQIISPTNERGALSCAALNQVARETLNPVPTFDRKLTFGPGDKIVRTKNGLAKLRDDADQFSPAFDHQDDSVRIVNGDLGVAVEAEQRKFAVDFQSPDRKVWVSRLEHHLQLAYCLTCHKMQGSEVEVVILPLHASFASMPMFNREWIYTAFSRATRFIITVGDLGVIERGVRKVGNRLRQTTLRDRLIGLGLPGRTIQVAGQEAAEVFV